MKVAVWASAIWADSCYSSLHCRFTLRLLWKIGLDKSARYFLIFFMNLLLSGPRYQDNNDFDIFRIFAKLFKFLKWFLTVDYSRDNVKKSWNISKRVWFNRCSCHTWVSRHCPFTEVAVSDRGAGCCLEPEENGVNPGGGDEGGPSPPGREQDKQLTASRGGDNSVMEWEEDGKMGQAKQRGPIVHRVRII